MLRAGLLGVAALLLLLALCATPASPVLHPDAPGAIAAGMAGLAAVHCENATVRGALAGQPSTTAMTTNASAAVVDAIEAARGGTDRLVASRQLRSLWQVVAGFALGAASGAASVGSAGFACLILPFGLLLAVIPWGSGAATVEAP